MGGHELERIRTDDTGKNDKPRAQGRAGVQSCEPSTRARDTGRGRRFQSGKSKGWAPLLKTAREGDTGSRVRSWRRPPLHSDWVPKVLQSGNKSELEKGMYSWGFKFSIKYLKFWNWLVRSQIASASRSLAESIAMIPWKKKAPSSLVCLFKRFYIKRAQHIIKMMRCMQIRQNACDNQINICKSRNRRRPIWDQKVRRVWKKEQIKVKLKLNFLILHWSNK